MTAVRQESKFKRTGDRIKIEQYNLKYEVELDTVEALEAKNDATGVDVKFVVSNKVGVKAPGVKAASVKAPGVKGNKHLKDKEKTYRLICKSPETRAAWVNLVKHQREEKKMKKIFGISLGEIIIREESNTGIPLVVDRLCTFLSEEPRITTEGIFRVAGRKEDTDALRAIFDRGGERAKTVGKRVLTGYMTPQSL